jgi:hypothetical protein
LNRYSQLRDWALLNKYTMKKRNFIILAILALLIILFAIEYSTFNAKYKTPQKVVVQPINN